MENEAQDVVEDRKLSLISMTIPEGVKEDESSANDSEANDDDDDDSNASNESAPSLHAYPSAYPSAACGCDPYKPKTSCISCGGNSQIEDPVSEGGMGPNATKPAADVAEDDGTRSRDSSITSGTSGTSGVINRQPSTTFGLATPNTHEDGEKKAHCFRNNKYLRFFSSSSSRSVALNHFALKLQLGIRTALATALATALSFIYAWSSSLTWFSIALAISGLKKDLVSSCYNDIYTTAKEIWIE